MAIPRSLKYLPLSGVYSLALSLGYIVKLAARNYWGGGADNIPLSFISTGPATAVRDYIPIVYVTAASMIMYYIFLFHQSAVAFSEFNKVSTMQRERKKSDDERINDKDERSSISMVPIKYGSDNINILAANRLVGNFHEQVIPFLVSLYLYATFVSVRGASSCGWAWIFFRSYYGYAFKKGLPILFLSTLPAYVCVWYMIGGTIYEISSLH